MFMIQSMPSEFIQVHPRILGCKHWRAAVRLCHWILKSDTCAVEQSRSSVSRWTAYVVQSRIEEPQRENATLRDFRPGVIQTGIYSHRKGLEAWKNGYKKKRDCTIRVAKKVKVGNDQEKTQSEGKFPLQKPMLEKTKLKIS